MAVPLTSSGSRTGPGDGWASLRLGHPDISPRMVKKLVACIMRSAIFDIDGIQALSGLLLSAGSAMALNYNPRPEQKLAHHTEQSRYEDQLPAARTQPEPCRLLTFDSSIDRWAHCIDATASRPKSSATPSGCTIVRCRSCRKDDGRPVEVGCQEQASNHPKRLSLRVAVVSVGEKSSRTRQVWIRKTNASEPLLTRREPVHDIETDGGWYRRDESGGCPEGCPGGVRRAGGVSLIQAFLRNCGNQSS
jgi:hypothetical protein